MIEIIFIYIFLAICVGLYASRFVNNIGDFITAGKSLPLVIILAMVFATWFGAESVLGISATFLEEGLSGLASDPLGASACLILFGLFFAKPLYKANLLTLGDFFKRNYSQEVEIIISGCIIISYIGWISAQISALGLIFFVLSEGNISEFTGIIAGAMIVLSYTLAGGMWSIAVTTFVQMIFIVLGLVLVSMEAANLSGGVTEVIQQANADGKLELFPSPSFYEFFLWVAAFLTMALGSIPQQDVFQRANAAKSERAAVWGTTLGGIFYFLFAAVPLFLAYSAFLIDPTETARLMEQDSQLVLPTLVLNHMPFWLQVLFFGSLVSVILSTAAGTLLAPSVLFTNNVVKYFVPNISNVRLLLYTRLAIIFFTVIVIFYAVNSKIGIHEMVENAYRVTLAGAFVPLAAGLFWSKASNFGAVLAIVFGVSSWLLLEIIKFEIPIEPQLIGLFFSLIGMIVGTYLKPSKTNAMSKREESVE